uniref:Putative secreted protein n=1 Tax=Anopheles triannulatus TaxID=58253 RepID=A0A2M4B2I7_9DIPT
MRYSCSLSTSSLLLAFSVSMNSSVASPSKPRIRYTMRIPSRSPPSCSHTFLYTSFTGRSRLMILLCTSSSMPLSSSSNATSSQSMQILFLTSRISGPRPASFEE